MSKEAGKIRKRRSREAGKAESAGKSGKNGDVERKLSAGAEKRRSKEAEKWRSRKAKNYQSRAAGKSRKANKQGNRNQKRCPERKAIIHPKKSLQQKTSHELDIDMWGHVASSRLGDPKYGYTQ